MRYDQRTELSHDGARVLYHLPDKDALGLADYSQADKIRQSEFNRKENRAFKKAFGVNAPNSKKSKNAPRREPDR